MSEGRAAMLDAIRRSLRRGAPPPPAPGPGPIPRRARPRADELLDRFVAMAEAAASTVVRLASAAEVPGAAADYLARHNLPAALRLAPDKRLAALPWGGTLLEVSSGAARPADAASLTPAFAGVAETGTLVLVSGPSTPTALNLLPDTHMVMLQAARVVGGYEDAIAALRAAYPRLPRTVNFITGPSRSADIEQTLQMGAHGPRRLHILLVDG